MGTMSPSSVTPEQNVLNYFETVSASRAQIMLTLIAAKLHARFSPKLSEKVNPQQAADEMPD